MTLSFLYLGLGSSELFILVIFLLLIIAVGNYGRNTDLGYWGSVLLAILSTPLVAFVILSIMKNRNRI